MHKQTLVFLFLITNFLLLSQQKTTLFFDANWLAPSSTNLRYYYCECFMFEDKTLHGPFNCFDIEKDDLVKKYYFEENRLHGDIEEYHPNGTIKLKASYNKGLPINEWKEWNKEGELIKHKTFDESSRMKKDYFSEKDFDEKIAMGNYTKKEEPPIYDTKCILKRIENEKYKCSEKAMLDYYKRPPIPPSYPKNGAKYVVKLKYLLSDKGIVEDTEILESSGDKYLDELATIHVLNMIPFEAAKQFGMPINYWINADIVFSFD